MAGVGFYAIESSCIVFGRDGKWYADGEPITNPRIALLFSRHLVQRPDGSYALVIGDEQAPVEVEDTPWVVTAIDDDRNQGFIVTLNDRTQEPLVPETLAVSADNALYCRVKGGTARARFLRSVHYACARYVEATGERGRFVIKIAGHRYSLTQPAVKDPG
jgi:hypothetical protein